MNIISYNVNGIRAAINKGLLDWLKSASPDVLLLQEIKATKEQLDTAVFEELGYIIIIGFQPKKRDIAVLLFFRKLNLMQ